MGAEIGLAALCLFLFCWRLGSIPLIDYDEALYVTCARQMVVSGDWITPRLNTRQPERPGVTAIPFFEKPILVYWAAAGAMRVLGAAVWVARLPVALASLLTTLVVYLTGRRWFTRRAGLLAALVYATVPMTLLDARQMTTDALLVLWITGALVCFRQAQNKAFSYLFWLFCALAVLTKGVVGLLLPFLVIGAFSLYPAVIVRLKPHPGMGLRPGGGRVLRDNIRLLRPLRGLLLFLLIAAPWHLLIAGRPDRDAQGRTWWQEYILRQHIGRFRGLDAVHNQPIFMFALYFLVGFFPWSCFVPAAFRAERSRKEADGKESSGEETGQASFLLTWFWTIFVFFSLGAAKLPTYITPAYPAAALLAGRWLDRALRDRRSAAGTQAQMPDRSEREPGEPDTAARSLQRGAMGACAVGVLLLIAALVLPARIPANVPLPAALFRFAQHVALVFTVGSALAWLCFRQSAQDTRLRAAGVAALAVMMTLFLGVAATEGYGVAGYAVMGPYQQLAIAARTDARNGIPVVFYSLTPRRPSMLFYAEYSPYEHKETGLLAFLAPALSAAQRQVDVITPGRAYQNLLLPEIEAAQGASVRILRRSETSDWILARIVLPNAAGEQRAIKRGQTDAK